MANDSLDATISADAAMLSEKANTQPSDHTSISPNPDEPYSTFTTAQKWLLVILVSVAATFSSFASNIYFPALPNIASDLGVSATLVSLTVTSYMIFQGVAPPFWGAVVDVRRRRVAYIFTFVVFVGACIGLAETRNYAMLVVLRCHHQSGEGGYMGIFQAGLLSPLAVGPVIGGILAERLGWRSIFVFLGIYSRVFLATLIWAFPETLRSIIGDGSRRPESLLYHHPLALYQKYQQHDDYEEKIVTALPHKSIDLMVPFRILVDKRTILAISFLTIYYAVWQLTVTIMSTLFSSTYHLSECHIGLTFIANGVGCVVGTMTTGKLLDLEYRWMKATFDSVHSNERQTDRLDFPIERARLRLVPLFALAQCAAVLVFGWTLQYHVHIAAPIVATFVIGWTAMSIQSAVMTYLVDIFHDQSASASAALNLARCSVGAAGTAAVDPMVKSMGVGGCFTLLAGLMLLGLGFMGMQAYMGRRIRREKVEG